MICKKFLRKNLLIPAQLNLTTKIFRTAVIQESLALNFKWNALSAEFRDSTRILNWLISFHIFHSCTILVYSIGHTGFLLHLARFQHCVIWASLVGAHRPKLEVEDFIFHAAVFSRETFQTLAWKFLLYVPQKVFGVYIFSNFVLV